MRELKTTKAMSMGMLLVALIFATVPAVAQDALTFGSSSVGSTFYVTLPVAGKLTTH